MKLGFNGFRRYVDHMRVDLPSQVQAETLTGVLSIAGVQCYLMHESALLVKYDSAANARKIAAQILLVVAESFGVRLDECVVEINDELFFTEADERDELANEIQKWAQKVAIPAAVPLDQVDPRGHIPVYWLKEG